MEKPVRYHFLKRGYCSITDFDKYKVFAAEKTSVAIKYMLKITLVFSLVVMLALFLKYGNGASVSQIQEDFPEIKEIVAGQDVEELLTDRNLIISGAMTVSFFVAALILLLIYVMMLSIVGYLLARLVNVEIPYCAIFNIAIYAHTLSIVLALVAVVLKVGLAFEVKYFYTLFTGIAMIYMTAVILLIKTDLINNQKILNKILAESERRILEEQEKEEQERLERQKREDKEQEKKEEKEEGTVGKPAEEGGKA